MAVGSETITIDRPIGEVFDFLCDGTRNSLWRPDVENVFFASGPAERAVWVQSIRDVDGGLRKADYRVTLYERPGRLELIVVNGPSRPATRFALKSLSPDSTRVTYVVNVKPLLWPFEATRFGAGEAAAEAANILNLPAAMAAGGRARD